MILSLGLVKIDNLVFDDKDKDGIMDELEKVLAERFAPEWRFNAKIRYENSKQNRNEMFYPSSMERFVSGLIEKKEINVQFFDENNTLKHTLPLSSLDSLCSMINPLDNTYLCGYEDDEYIKLDFPKKIHGEPGIFPTYYNCRKEGEDIAIAYFLFYPYDYKGKFSFLNLEFGYHRGDFEGINILISGIEDFTNLSSVDETKVKRVFYSGHGLQRYVTPFESEGYNNTANHTKVYLSFGSHTCYPEPGIFYDWKLEGLIPDIYDDFFLGNGLVVKSWERDLINLGEVHAPLVSWLNYRGLFGTDASSGGGESNASPPSPPWKGAWHHYKDDRISWNEIKERYSEDWRKPFKSHHIDTAWNNKQNVIAIFFSKKKWTGNTKIITEVSKADVENVLGKFKSKSLIVFKQGICVYGDKNYIGKSYEITKSYNDISEIITDNDFTIKSIKEN